MLYLALGCAILAAFLWLSREPTLLKGRQWKLLSGAAAVAVFSAAAFVGARGGWGKAIVLVVLGLGLAVSARRTGQPGPKAPLDTGKLSATQARSILGVRPGASAEEIQAAYSRLMRMAHPDRGGTDGLAAQLNAARDRLLKG